MGYFHERPENTWKIAETIRGWRKSHRGKTERAGYFNQLGGLRDIATRKSA